LSCVLVVEDELAIREVVTHHLSQAGFTVIACATALEAWRAVSQVQVVVLDWMLPDESGPQWLRRLRQGPHANLPVLMLTARAAEMDRVEGLDAGADDYLTKPFSGPELAARIRALLRRARNEPVQMMRVAGLELTMETHTATLHGNQLELTRREFDLLAFLATHPDRVYSRQEILDKVWGLDFVGGERTVDQHITQLRALLHDDPQQPRLLETIRGRGYRLKSVP
jgi:DNA-binding response OmpR family regulator